MNIHYFFVVGSLICKPLNETYFNNKPLPKVGDILFDYDDKCLGIVYEIDSDEHYIVFVHTDVEVGKRLIEEANQL